MWVGVLGPLTVRVGDREVEIAGARLRALLCRLAVEPGRRVSSAELVAAVWPDDPPADPVNALQSLVSRLRRALGLPGVIVQETTGYRLLITPDDLDAAAFGHRLRRARELIGIDDDAADRELTDALALWRDEALTDAGDGDYIRGYAARWAEDRLLAIKERAHIHCDAEPGRSCWAS